MKSRRLILLILAVILAFAAGLGLLQYSYETYQTRKIDFVKLSAEQVQDTPFDADMIDWYLRAMDLTPKRNGKVITVEYNGFFVKKQWTIRAKK